MMDSEFLFDLQILSQVEGFKSVTACRGRLDLAVLTKEQEEHVKINHMDNLDILDRSLLVGIVGSLCLLSSSRGSSSLRLCFLLNLVCVFDLITLEKSDSFEACHLSYNKLLLLLYAIDLK